MTYLFCDTSVLLNLSTDIKLYDVLVEIEELVDKGEVKLVICDVVKFELSKHEDSIVGKRIASYNSHLKNTRHIYDFLTRETKELLKKEIKKAHSDLPKMEGVLKKNLKKVIELIDQSLLAPNTQQHKNNVIKSAADKTFPFHRNKNSVNDALISEAFKEFAQYSPADCDRIYFITDNTTDFSDINNKTLPHPDWADTFVEDQIIYSINIATVINSIHPNSVDKEIEKEIQDRSAARCIDGNSHKFDTTKGFWQNSRYGGGLSWQYRCEKCGIAYDTGEYWD